jgi:hypothetical protein
MRKYVSGAGGGDSNCYDRDRFEDDGVLTEITSNPKTATVNITTIIPHAPPDALKQEQESDQETALRSRRSKVSPKAILRGNVAAPL